MAKRFIIIDGNSLINRAYYAMRRPMITSEGVYTQGIYGFLNMLNRIQDDYVPDYIAVAWDLKAPTFRHKAYEDYKAGRKKMPMELAMELPLMKDILDAMKIKNLELEGFEADDIIGTMVKRGEAEGLEPLVITGDKDALQLASDKTKVLITKKGISDFDLYDEAKMKEVYGLTPEQFIDLKGLMGDKSDNIPGVPGIGQVTGTKLLEQFGTLSNLLQHTDEIKNKTTKEKIEANVQQCIMSRELAEINTNAPVDVTFDQLKVEEPDYSALIELYKKLEFNSFLKKLDIHGQSEQTDIFDDKMEVFIIKDDDDMRLLDQLKDGEEIIIKGFSDYTHIDSPEFTGFGFLAKDKYYYIPGDKPHDTLFDIIDTTGEVMYSALDELQRKKVHFIGHDLINEFYGLFAADYEDMTAGFDTAIAAYVLDSAKSNYNLNTLLLENFHTELPEKDDKGMYWCQAVKALMEVQKKKLADTGMNKVFTEAELPLIKVLASMESEGFAVDKDQLNQFGTQLKGEIDDLLKKIYDLAGEEFNPNSPKQLGQILFEKLGLPAGKKTKSGYSTSADILEKIKDKHEIVPAILNYRSLTKLNSTYVEGLVPLIGYDGRIRAHFMQTVAATGRISCTEPNLQNIPIRDDYGRQLRKAFKPAGDDRILIGADYSQIELRVLAHLSQDQSLIDAFNNGEDIHRMTASKVFNIDYDKVTPLDRSRAKAVNFGVIYGMSSFGLSEELHITRKEAEGYIKDYFEKHPAVKAYMDSQVAMAKEKGYTETILGRRRYIHEINSSNYVTRNFGERLAMNSPIQGSAADIIKLAMIKVDKELRDKKYLSKLILQIHDELIIDAYKDEEKAVRELLERNMKEAIKLSVNLETDVHEGSTWYDLK